MIFEGLSVQKIEYFHCLVLFTRDRWLQPSRWCCPWREVKHF